MLASIQLIDTHTHLQSRQFEADRALILQRAAAAGVSRMIEVGYDLATSRAAVALAAQHSHIWAVVGIQPNSLQGLQTDWLPQIRQLAAHPKVVGIGEIGLDFHWKKAPLAAQEQVFRAQIALAQELGLPIVIHSREAQEDTVRILRDLTQEKQLKGIMHSFSGDWDYAKACLDAGLLLSFSGPVTFAKAKDLHEVARRIPLAKLLIETDSPYLSPHPFRGQRNEPARVQYVAEKLAEIRRLPLSSLAAAVWQNASQVFGLEA